MKYDIIIIGAGAAGLAAACEAVQCGKSVAVIERNAYPGKKLNITGKGRCNVTNDCDIETYLSNVPRGSKFLYKAINVFPPKKVIEFFESNGVKTVTERGRRVFPESNKARDITDALVRAAKGVKFIKGRVTDIIAENGKIKRVCVGTDCYECDSVIIATGGASYSATGSTGDGYTFAKKLGHTVIEPTPSLVPMNAEGDVCASCMGLSLKNVKITLLSNKNKKLYTDFGEMLFTHFGVSGPLVISASAHIKSEDFPATLNIDLKPALDEGALDKRIRNDFELYKNKDFSNALNDLLPQSIIPAVIQKSKIPPNKKVNSVTKEERRALVTAIKEFSVVLTSFRPFEEAIITRGGIKLSEVNPSTMMSKLIDGLYFAGEVLDIDCYTGGYNLQAAFATGFLAGREASARTS